SQLHRRALPRAALQFTAAGGGLQRLCVGAAHLRRDAARHLLSRAWPPRPRGRPSSLHLRRRARGGRRPDYCSRGNPVMRHPLTPPAWWTTYAARATPAQRVGAGVPCGGELLPGPQALTPEWLTAALR